MGALVQKVEEGMWSASGPIRKVEGGGGGVCCPFHFRPGMKSGALLI